MESQYHKGFNPVKYMTSENLNMTNISKALLNKNIWAQGWHVVAGIVKVFCAFISLCIFSGLSVLPWQALWRFGMSEAEDTNPRFCLLTF